MLAAVALFAVAAMQGCDENEPAITVPDHVHTLAILTVEPTLLAIEEGETYQLTALPACECGQEMDVAVEWSTSDPSVATVDGNGLVTGISEGEVDIRARAEGQHGPVEAGSRVGVGKGTPGKGDTYAELVYLYRNEDGLPLLREVAGEMCLQPVSYSAVPDVDPVTNPVNGEDVWLLPLVGDAAAASELTVFSDEDHEDGEEELEACDVQAEYADYALEVEIGRLNLGRSPDHVLDRALAEVYDKLDEAADVFLDHAGRLAPDDAPIDAPRENMAIQRELELTGALGGYGLPWPTVYQGYLDHASSGMGAAADKFGEVGTDLVVYYDRLLDFPNQVEPGGMSTITGDGTVGILGRKYLDYGDFSYDRGETFPGCVVGFELVGEEMVPFEGTLMDIVFDGEPFTADNVHGFAQRTDDVRAVILFEHDTVIVEIDRIGEAAVCEANDIE